MATRGSSRCCERPADRAPRSRLAVAAQAACDVGDERLSALIDLMLLWLLAARAVGMAIARVSSSEPSTWVDGLNSQ